jgi:hypothetical protein
LKHYRHGADGCCRSILRCRRCCRRLCRRRRGCRRYL